MNIKRIKLVDVKPAAYNPRRQLKPGEKEYEALKASISRWSLVEPLVVNLRTGNLVGGHQRYNVLLDLGHTEAEAAVVDLDEKQEKLLNVALNRIEGQWDYEKLQDLFEEFSAEDIFATGYSDGELKTLFGGEDEDPTLIRAAKEAGADSVTTEFFCMESRADDRLKARYAAMSEVLGYDIHQFYMENSKQQGYKRLNRAIKAPIIHRMRELTHSLGMRFHVSDAFCRECNDACNCCGVPPEWGVSQTGNIGNAIIIAREKGFVTFSDVMESINKYFDFPWVGACGYNTGSNKARALLYDTTMAQWLRSNWNDTKKGTSPARAYGGVLVPDGKDENGDVIYRYAIKR